MLPWRVFNRCVRVCFIHSIGGSVQLIVGGGCGFLYPIVLPFYQPRERAHTIRAAHVRFNQGLTRFVCVQPKGGPGQRIRAAADYLSDGYLPLLIWRRNALGLIILLKRLRRAIRQDDTGFGASIVIISPPGCCT